MPNILISYRRADSDAIAGRIRDRVAMRFGEEAVFMDIDSIPIGLDFRDHVKNALMHNDLVLAIIGPKWHGAGRGASARIQEETDPVRMEIETALARGIPVIPVLVGGATIPKPADLPDGLKDLSYRNAAEVSSGRDFNQHVERLLRSIDRLFEMKSEVRAPAGEASPQPISSPRDVERKSDPLPAQPGAALRPATGVPQIPIATRLLVAAGLRFADPALEQRFNEHFRERFYWVAQMAMAASILGWVLFGPVDLWSASGGISSTRFRFMFAAPAMVIMFGLSFTAFARRWWQAYTAGYAVLGISCMTFALTLVTSEPWFVFEQATMTYMIFLAFVALAPFTFVNMFGVGLFVVGIYAWFFSIYAGQLPAVRAIFCTLFVVAFYAIGCCGAYARERNFRWEFKKRAESERPIVHKVQ